MKVQIHFRQSKNIGHYPSIPSKAVIAETAPYNPILGNIEKCQMLLQPYMGVK